MNKSQLVLQIASRMDSTKPTAEAALNAVIESIAESLAKGEAVSLVGFGTFNTAKRRSKVGRNPKTGDQMTIPETTVVKFKPGKSLKEIVQVKA
jgi:DNA-binding protein HU-beta